MGMSILIVSLKVGWSLNILSALLYDEARRGRIDSLVLLERLSIEGLMLARNVHPQASFASDGAGPIDLKPHAISRNGWRREVDVRRLAGEIGRSIVFERQEVDGV